MTQEQLNILATKVLKWVLSVNRKLWHSLNYNELALHINNFQPHKDLNQAIKLIDAFNENNEQEQWIDIRGGHSPGWWEVIVSKNCSECGKSKSLDKSVMTKDLAFKICEVILKNI